MSYELHYTSVAKGLKPGSRGFCTVACTAGLPGPLAERLEALSGYRPVFPDHSPDAARNPVAYSHVHISIGGKTYSVLSRVAPSGRDYTDRANKYAQHVALDLRERPRGGPAWTLAQPGVLRESWEGEPRVLPSPPSPPAGDRPPGIAHAWKALTGDAGWAGALADSFLADPRRPVYLLFEPGQSLLPLFEESIALLPASRRWEVTFSTYAASIPQGVPCLWKAIPGGSPEARAALRQPNALVIDLTAPMPPAPAGTLVTLAREGAPEGVQEDVQEDAPSLPEIEPETPRFLEPGAARQARPGPPTLGSDSYALLPHLEEFASSRTRRRKKAKPPRRRTKLAVLIALPVLLLLGAVGGSAYWLMNARPGSGGLAKRQQQPPTTTDPAAPKSEPTTATIAQKDNPPNPVAKPVHEPKPKAKPADPPGPKQNPVPPPPQPGDLKATKEARKDDPKPLKNPWILGQTAEGKTIHQSLWVGNLPGLPVSGLGDTSNREPDYDYKLPSLPGVPVSLKLIKLELEPVDAKQQGLADKLASADKSAEGTLTLPVQAKVGDTLRPLGTFTLTTERVPELRFEYDDNIASYAKGEGNTIIADLIPVLQNAILEVQCQPPDGPNQKKTAVYLSLREPLPRPNGRWGQIAKKTTLPATKTSLSATRYTLSLEKGAAMRPYSLMLWGPVFKGTPFNLGLRAKPDAWARANLETGQLTIGLGPDEKKGDSLSVILGFSPGLNYVREQLESNADCKARMRFGDPYNQETSNTNQKLIEDMRKEVERLTRKRDALPVPPPGHPTPSPEARQIDIELNDKKMRIPALTYLKSSYDLLHLHSIEFDVVTPLPDGSFLVLSDSKPEGGGK